MAKEKFNWKALFVNDENASIEKEIIPEEEEKTISFPSDSNPKPKNKYPPKPRTQTAVDNSILGKVVEMYESGFDSLNKPGYDFYEFFKAIKSVGKNDSSVYQMAFSMAKGIDANVSKESLLEQSNFYIQEIDKVHQQYHGKGQSKKTTIQNGLKSKKESLTSEISDLDNKISELQIQLSNKKNQLQSIDSDLIKDISDVEQKIVANNLARTKILDTINVVIEGIKNNL